MRCQFCGKEVDVWWVHDDKWCCKECKKKFKKTFMDLL
jgi:ribosomal protein L37AE/L43A